MTTSTSTADIPLYTSEYTPFTLEMTVSQDDKVICETRLEGNETQRGPHDTGCAIAPLAPSKVTILGQLTGRASGRFSMTYTLVDIAPVTGILRDESLDFGTRLDTYYERLLELDPSVSDFHFNIKKHGVDVPKVMANAAQSAGVSIPPEFEAFATRNVQRGDHSYIGPAQQLFWKPDIPDWPNLTKQEIQDGVPREYLPQEGTETREWYDRVRVIFVNVGDGHAPIVWDPMAKPDQPAFFWLDEDTRGGDPFLYLDGTPVSALDALLTPLDWTDSWDEMRFDAESWIYRAVKQQGYDPSDESIILIDTSNTRGRLNVTFNQASKIPLFRKVTPYLSFQAQTWFPR